MSCKPFKTSEANAKSYLKTKGVIDKYLNVKDLGKFRTLHSELRQQAKDKYFSNVEGWNEKLFLENKQGTKVYPNTKVFKEIDKISTIRESIEEKETSKKIEKEAKLTQMRDAKRAGLEYDEDYLFNAAETTGITVGTVAKASYFKNSNTRKSSEVLLEISKSNHPLNKLAEKLLPYVKANDVDIVLTNNARKFKLSDGSEATAAGTYFPTDNNILLYTNSPFPTIEKLILHEVLHSISYFQLRQRNDTNEDLFKLYEHAKKNLPKSYELENIDEFLVGIFTDSKFIKELQKLPAIETKKYKNYLEEFLDHLFKYLGFKKGTSLYEQAFDIATNVLEEQKNYLEYEQYNQQFLENEPVEPLFAPSQDKSFEPKEIKPGVKELFNNNSELSSIGTPQQYSQYLDTIFPDSQVKDIVYHTTFKKFIGDKFNKPSEQSLSKGADDGIFFSKDPNYYTKEGFKIASILNLKTPMKYSHGIFMSAIDASGYRQVKDSDGFITYLKEPGADMDAIKPQFPDIDPSDFSKEELEDIENSYQKALDDWKELANKEELVFATVFEPEQIHILGSKDDIKGFKEFVDSNKSFDPKEESDVDEFVDDEFNFDDLAAEYAANQQQKQTKEEAGIETDSALDDEVITNFDKVLSYKKSLRSKLKDRIANLQAMIKDAESKEEALSFARKENQLQERLDQLENDIIDTESGYSYGKLKFQAQQDLQRLQTLLESENVNDINEAKRIINFYKAMSFNAKKVTLDNDPITSHPIFFEEEIFDADGKMQLPQQTIDFFENLSKAFAGYETQLEQKQKKALENIINSHPTIKQLYSEDLSYKHLTAPIGDISWVDMMIMDPSKTISANNVIPQVMMDITQRIFAEKISKAKQFEEKHNKALVKAEKALRSMGAVLSALNFTNPSFDIFFQKSMGRNTGRLVNRYNQDFFDTRATIQADFKEQLRLIRTSGLDEQAKNKLLKQAYQERQQWYRENVLVFDIRRLREVREAFPDLADEYFDEVDDNHRKELIENLGSEQAYKEEVAKQIKQIKKYFVWKEANRQMALEENGVDTFEQLSENVQADIMFNEAAKSPFTGADYFYYGDVQIGNKFVNSSMEYNISVPRRYKAESVSQDKSGRYVTVGKGESTGYYDKQFEQIEKNKDLYEYYQIVQEQMTTILNSFPTEVQEQLFSNSLPTVQKTFREILSDPNISLYKKLWNALVDFYDRVRGGFGINPQSSISFENEDVITGKTEPTVNAEFLNNNKSRINDLLTMELIKANNLPGMGKLKIRRNGTIDVYKLPSSLLNLISEKTNIAPTYEALIAKYGERIPVGKILENSVMADIIQDSSTDLPKLIRYYNMMAAEYTARQELLPYMEMMKNHYTQIQKPKTNKQGIGVTNIFSQQGQTEGLRTRANTQMEDWFNRVILGNRDAKAFGVIDSENVDSKTLKDKIGNLISGRILSQKDKELNKKLNEMINDSKDENEINKLLKIKANLGKQVSASAAFENLFNYIRYLGLGYNLSSGITNYMEGQIANMIIAANGDHFEPHHYYRALNIVKGSLFKSVTGNTNRSTQGSRKLRVLVDRYNILQDSTNELQKASVKTSLDVLDKFTPMEINKRTEYLNQTPLMLSVMFDTEIIGKNGQKSNPWDAMDINGKLLPEFRTEENIKTWELGQGEAFTSFKTKTSQAIGMAHGLGYDNLRGMMAKSSTMGKALMMFKTWVGSQLYTRFASERDDVELGVKGYKGRYRSHTKASLSIMGGIVGWGFGGPLLGAAVGFATGHLIGKRTGVRSNLSTLGEYAFLGKAIARKMIGMPVNFIGSTFTGKQVMNEFVGYEKLIKQGKLGEGKFTERDMKNMRALVTEMSLQLTWIALSLIAKSMFWDDDDEEDSPERIAHNLIVNRTLQVLASSNMYATPEIWTNLVSEQPIIRFFNDVTKFVGATQEWVEGNDIITRGINAGDSKTANAFYKIALPSIVRDSYFGFSKQMEMQFEKTHYDDWYFDDTKKANKILEGKRAVLRAELEEQGVPDKQINKILNKRFPLLKDIKNPDSRE